MTFSPAWRTAVAVLLAAVVGGSLTITGYLARLEAGVLHNVRAAQALVDAQRFIRDKNAALESMVTGTDRIGAGLEVIVAQSEALGAGVGAVAQASRDTLALNNALGAHNADAARDLARVVAALRAMKKLAAEVRDSVADLSDTAAADLEALRAIGANTARMNARTPGWLP